MILIKRLPSTNPALSVFCAFAVLAAISLIGLVSMGAMQTVEGARFAISVALLVLLGIGLIVFNVDNVQHRASVRCLVIMLIAMIPAGILCIAATIAGGGAIR